MSFSEWVSDRTGGQTFITIIVRYPMYSLHVADYLMLKIRVSWDRVISKVCIEKYLLHLFYVRCCSILIMFFLF